MGVTVIKSVRLFDGNKVYPSSTVTFDTESGNIISVDTSSSADVPQGAEERAGLDRARPADGAAQAGAPAGDGSQRESCKLTHAARRITP